MQNIFAFTQQASFKPYVEGNHYPGYVSLNESFGEVKMTVRTPGLNGAQTATCPMTDLELSKLAESILRYLAEKP